LRNAREVALRCARALLLAGPVVLAFFSGGYFDEPRVWAGLVAWALVAVAAAASPCLFPTSRPALLAIGGLGLLAAWTMLSLTWSPLAGTAYHDGQRVILYTGGLLAATALLRGDGARLAEPAIAGGILVVVGYGLSERLFPSLLTFQHSLSAQGRLEQPLTYWNAMGAIAALGVVLCARMAGDDGRPLPLRSAAAAAAAPLGLGLYASFSRGALFACVAGLLALVVLAPTRSGLRGIVVAVGAVVLSSLAAAPFAGVTSILGSRSDRVLEGAVVFVLLLVITTAAALTVRLLAARERSGQIPTGTVRLPRHAGALTVLVVVASFGLFLLVGAKEKSAAPLSAGATRLTSLQSNRYAYWRVAWRAFKAEPVHGVGGGGWAVYWLRYRPIDSGAQDAHSLYVQTAAELGVIGLALLAALFTGVVLAARRAWRFAPAVAAGPIAGLVVWASHVTVDWDWEMPAVTLLAIGLAGTLLGLCDDATRSAGQTAPATARP
jgi:O-antigen ligase